MSDIIINPYVFVGGPISSYDPDAQNYIDRVEAADGAALETVVKDAMNQLFLDLKSNSLWTPLVYALPGSGPRTLAGGYIPLQNAEAAGDLGVVGWDRKTGFNVNDAAAMGAVILPSSYPENAVGAPDNFSISIWLNQLSGATSYLAGSNNNEFRKVNTNQAQFRSMSGTGDNAGNGSDVTGFRGMSRSNSSNYTRRLNGSNATISRTSGTPNTSLFRLFRVPPPGFRTPGQASTGTKIGWYHIGTALDLEDLETTVATYLNTINAAV
jgi:hypothetical protein